MWSQSWLIKRLKVLNYYKKLYKYLIELTKKDNRSQTEYQKYLEEICDLNYQGGSWILPENITPLEQTKYEICKKLVSYKLDTKISTEEMSQKNPVNQNRNREYSIIY